MVLQQEQRPEFARRKIHKILHQVQLAFCTKDILMVLQLLARPLLEVVQMVVVSVVELALQEVAVVLVLVEVEVAQVWVELVVSA
jgi:hypothetical protein